MRKTLLTATALALTMSVSAFAQSPNTPPTTNTPAPPAASSGANSGAMNKPADSSAATTSSSTSAAITANGQWQASKFIGLDVYNSQNEKIGDITELMLDKSGKIDTVAIGVGGFLGMGTHNVAVKFDQLKFVDEPIRSAATESRPVTTGAATTGTGSSNTGPTGGAAMKPMGGATASGPATMSVPQKKNYPDHALLDMSKDQLKGMPQFDYTK